MDRAVRLPDLGESVTEAYVVEWLVPLGGTVAAGAPLLLVEAEKVQVEVVSPYTGTVTRHLVAPDDPVSVDGELATIEIA